MTVRTHSDEETKKIARELVERLEPGAVLALVGDLGAGKTTFVQGIAQALGVIEAITSPTFVLLQSYEITNERFGARFHVLNHLDLYRLETLDEIKNIGIEDVLTDPHAITVIEWADRATTLLPPRTMWIEFGFVDDEVREIEVDVSN